VYKLIITVLGGIGSGKTLSVVKELADSKNFAFTNFNLKSSLKKKYRRIHVDDVIIRGEKRKDDRINWEFWDDMKKEHKNFSIYLDEVHNLIHSRSSMSKTNILMSKWVSQIRKITSDSPNNHLYLISQTLRKIDVDFRELSQVFIKCQKITSPDGKVWIKRYYYDGLIDYQINKVSYKRIFLGNPYFKYYNTEEMVKFSDEGTYV
jgi:hypothetical protein